MLFASGSDDDGYDGYDDDPDEPAQSTRRTPGAQRGGGSSGGGGGSGSGNGRQRSVQFQPEERYWTEYLRIALPIIGLLLMIGLFWYWASQLTDDGNGSDEPTATLPPGTTEVITPPSSPEPTQEQIVQPTEPAETPAGTPDDGNGFPVEETPEEATEDPAADGAFAVGDFVTVVEGGVNMRSDPTTAGENIVRALEGGEVLEIQGEPVEADGFTWYEVLVSETGEIGWVAAADPDGNPFIELAE